MELETKKVSHNTVKFLPIFDSTLFNLFQIEPIVLVHGGAGDIPDSRNEGKFQGSKLAARIGYKVLTKEGGSVLDAVEAAVKSMELDENFNCGYGSVLTRNQTVEVEASIMEGTTLKAGCCTLLKEIMHPISVARKVMDTPHCFLGGDAAIDFAKESGFEMLKSGSLVTMKAREALEEFLANHTLTKSEVGTVGAVAIDQNGNLAAATSTGGRTGKYQGRIGDTPLLGSGTYADNRFGAVSTTGMGECIMRFVLAKDIVNRIEFLGLDAQTATQQALNEMAKRTGGTAGAITLDKEGNIGCYWTSEKMSWAYQKADKLHWGISKDLNKFCEDIDD